MVEYTDLLIQGGVSLFMAFMTFRIAVGILKAKSKSITAQQLMASLGFKNFNVKDLNVLTEDGFKRLIFLVRELKPPSTGGAGDLAQFMALVQGMSGVPGMQTNPNPQSNVGELTR